ncbi:MAG: hypothetical protein A3J52_02120 [Omnitrophica bacterium RIFCSPHIGHO2_02_FULL_49_9]|nr:MAG: hypothetical protein A3J52_02120 [Omnitrophica bacterium RIFCSPHIGHO2_02_FULL_49_9]
MDANFNRLKEGLRVCEDVLRFVYEDQRLTASLKRFRHRCSAVMLSLPVTYRKLVSVRESQRDVGKNHSIRDRQLLKWYDLFVSNMKRAQESLRVLEETAKVVVPAHVRKFQSLRFGLYGLEKKILKKL